MKLFAIGISLILLQAPNASAEPQETPKSGNIEGIVLRAGTDQPVVGAQVSWTSSLDALNMFNGPNPNPSATTDNEGKFAFRNLRPANYLISVMASGYVRQEYGQRIINGNPGNGRPITLSAGQTVKDLAIPLAPSATVSGRIVTDMGMPASDILVQLVRADYGSAGTTFHGVGMANADDRGEYRIFGVTPGRYYLVAGNVQVFQQIAPGAGDVSVIRVSRTSYGITYFPDAAEFSNASRVELKPGAEFQANLIVKPQQTGHRIAGRVVDADTGQIAPAGTVSLTSQLSPQQTIQPMLGAVRNTSPTPGAFEFLNVPPGAWLVRADVRIQYPPQQGPIDTAAAAARSQAQAMSPSGQTPVTMSNADIDGLVVTLRAGATMPAKVLPDGNSPVSQIPNLDRISINVTPVLPSGSVAATRPGADGVFQFFGLREGVYSVRASGLPPGYYLKTVRYAGQNVPNLKFQFSGSSSDALEVTLRQGAAQLSGVVVDSRSQPVSGTRAVLIPEESLRGRTDLYKAATTDQNGRFTMANVPPGSYMIFSWEAIEPNGYYDPDVIRQYEAQGVAIRVEESSSPTVEVKWIPAPGN